MAESTINNKELASDLSLIRDIGKEMESLNTMTRAGLNLFQSINNVEIEILKSMKGKNASEQSSLDTSIKIKGIHTEIANIMGNSKTSSEDMKKALTKQVQELFKQQKIQEELVSDSQHIKDAWKDLDKSFGGIFSRLKSITKLLKLEPELIALSVALYIFKKIYSVFDQLDSAAADFRKSMGIMRSQSDGIEKVARDIAIQYTILGVTAKDVYESFKSISEEAGSSLAYTTGLVKDMSLFSAQFGITTKSSAQFLKSIAIISGGTLDTSRDMMLIAQSMSAAAGVPLDSIMQDVAASAKESYQFLSKNPLELIKAAINAKEMGTSLQSAVKSSSSLLNFTESVKSEMEASVLLGKSMNLQKVRELAYHRDIKGLNNEILKLAKESNFEQLDPFQQDAVAKALGKSAGEIAGMLESDREHSKILAAMTSQQRTQYNLMMGMQKSEVKSYAEKARQEIESMSNQKATAAIAAAWSSIFAKLGASVFPTIASILTFVAKNMNTIKNISILLGSIWLANKLIMMATSKETTRLGFGLDMILKKSKTILAENTAGFSILAKKLFGNIGVLNTLKLVWVTFLDSIPVGITTAFASIGTWLVGLFSSIGTGLLAVVMSPISWIIAAFAAGFGIGTLLNKFKWVQNAAQAIWLVIFKIGDGIKAVGGMIYDALKKPFVDVWNWLKGLFLGNSPSTLGLMIVDGIMAVESMLIKALISPFQKAWDFIKGLPIISHFFGGSNIAAESTPQPNTNVSMDKSKVDVDSKQSTPTNVGTTESNDMISKKMDLVVDAINSLRADLKAGMITSNVFIDSQKLDSAVGRRLAYTGQLT